MKKSKRIEALDNRPVNKDGFIDEWPEMGFVAMHSPYDPAPSIRVEDGRITEMDGKKREEFDFLDSFIADYAIRVDRAEASMAVPSLEIARKIVDIHVSRQEVLELVSGITPAKMVEVINHLNVVELMMGMQKMRARRVPGNQAHITNLKDDPVQIAADAAEGALRGFSEEETTMGIARYAPFSAMALLIGSQVGRPG
ncbi:MAG TPA: propanediol dehydratase, partial [Candidatus Limivivens merdigallinarum]|nr:propanediol dehydratase [Candidatus Limivivens merdigallinarum]